jgi:hypothetical protein
MATQSPSQILRKSKRSVDDEHDTSKKDADKDDKKGEEKGSKRSALIDFIAKNKKA